MNAKPKKKIVRREVRVRTHTYKPTKAELEETFVIQNADGSIPTLEKLELIALSTAHLIKDPDT